jgi:AraC-like DNA-binding protein
MMSMRVVRILIAAVAEAGVPSSTFLRAAKLDPASVSAVDARLPRSKLFELFELALELTGDPAFGLHSQERLMSSALDPIAALVNHSATLREAMDSIQESRSLLGDKPSFRIHEEGGNVIIRCDSLADEALAVRRYTAEVVLVGMFRLIRRVHARGRIDCVAFEYGAPAYHREYTRIFEGLARFDQSFTGIRFGRELMAAAAPHPDAELHEALRVFAARRSMHLNDRSPYATRVRDVLVWQRPPRDMTMASVARKLGMSVRSLRRRLTAEGKSYADLMDEALASIAKACLRDERRTILDTARELGFADSTGFHRAFKRWTGLTPLEFRRQALDADDAGGEAIFCESRSRREGVAPPTGRSDS